uniref:Uncharacterized protein n=1 Tax=Melopsittacus undulatus TaxID=13146 RepID=A0A8C6JVH8_MELUD
QLEPEHTHVSQVTSAMPLVIFLFGALFNALALWVFFCKIKKWTETRVYVINLVSVDCFVICTLPFMVCLLWNKSPQDELCQFIETAYFINMLASITFRSPPKAALLSGLLWVSVVVVGATAQIWQSQSTLCLQKDTTVPAALSLLSMFFGFILPLAILTFCSIEVIRSLKRWLNTSSPEKKSIQKAFHIIFANLIVFLVCFLTAFFGLFARFARDSIGATCFMLQVMKNVSSVTKCIATSNCCLDSVCCYFVTKGFCEALLPSKTQQTNPEEARTWLL